MKIGILGGGQLAKMLALAGIPLGYRFVFFDPSPDVCASSLGQHIQADYDNWTKLKMFAEGVDLVTFEFENIPLATVNFVNQYCTVLPKESALESTQDRLIEKILFRQLGLPAAVFLDISSRGDLEHAVEYLGLPMVLKSRFDGYNGKGQFFIKSQDELSQVWSEIDGIPFIAEEWVNFTREVSVIAARNENGNCVFYELVENVHHQGILQTSVNRPNDPLSTKARSYAQKLMIELDYCGILTLELFQVGDELLVNEFAPRVHNSGHWTIEGAFVSQFENHLRAILNLPLGETKHVARCAMVNFIGILPPINELLNIPNSHFHQYGKHAKIGRKLGHITICSDQSEVAESYAYNLLAQLQATNQLSELIKSTPV